MKIINEEGGGKRSNVPFEFHSFRKHPTQTLGGVGGEALRQERGNAWREKRLDRDKPAAAKSRGEGTGVVTGEKNTEKGGKITSLSGLQNGKAVIKKRERDSGMSRRIV